MKKKITAIVLVIAMVAIAVAGGTLAYFTDTDAAQNVMTVGNVAIVQDEQQKVIGEEVDDAEVNSEYVIKENDNLETFEQNKKLFPMVNNCGENDPVIVDGYFNGKMANVIDKIVTVSNDGSEDAYVRTIIAFETATEYEAGTSNVRRDGKTIFDTYIGTLGDFDLLNRNTITIDGVEYVLAVKVYDAALAPEETSAPSLKQFFLSPDADNETSLLFGNEYTILALSQGVQTAGFEPVLDADGNVVKSAAAVALDAAFGDLETVSDEVLIEWLSAALPTE